VIVEIECVPEPLGADGDPYRHVDAAIAVIRASGLRHEVGALGTTVEGEPDELWALLRRVHEAPLAAGARRVLSIVKVEQSDATVDELLAPYR
jgi:uncharacterized protein YqgV (UPF0045/DUF77 family)